ncbi:choice-of-anchor B family protein [uncultured Paraglaciecola sp.]|uniref:choice-of-anchor B family protein n=1 Tax=uncultured Paraglaciecola sp. TaxID=1765024 RepID=UPI0026348BD2|nr:choice-of-anchor B family protein [uncultured Paraglaciecola sp.]
MILTLGCSQDVQAHAEHDKARFVATTGHDQGTCNNRFRPCKTVSFAVKNANKGDTILVAQGQYSIKSEQDLLYFTGQIVPVLGGFSLIEQYQGQNPDTYQTTVTGVPVAYAQQLSQQGFHVIRDTKALSKSYSSNDSRQFSKIKLMQNKQVSSPCINGNADGFACENMSLLAHVPLADFPNSPSAANDIWGHVDLNSKKEYAIIGLKNGVSVVDVTSPTSPAVVGSVQGLSSTWRDIKVYQYFDAALLRWQAYAYSTTEANEGLTIIDLNDLENGITVVNRQTTDRSAHNIYISGIDYTLNIATANQTPAVHILGSNQYGGAFRSYSLGDPETLGTTYRNLQGKPKDYSHDASSLVVKDARAQTDCIQTSNNGCLVFLDFNEDSLIIWDHTDKNQAIRLGTGTYPNAEYTHSGWWTEDKQFVIVHDELDEQRRGLNTTLNIFDISSLSSPTLVGTWTGPTRASDHNGFVRGNRYYMSNYERGLTVLDITDPSTPLEVGFFDTYPVSNNATFNGAWGVYPFLPSGNILVSDINSGLYIIQDQTLANETGNIAFSASQVSVNEGDNLNIEVLKTGIGATSVGYEVLPGSAGIEDIILTSGELTWANNDNQTQSIQLQTTPDALDEITETLFIRLFDPKNSATLVQPSMLKVSIIDALQQGKIVFATNEIKVKETGSNIQIPVTRQGGSDGALTVTYEFTSGSAILGEDVTASNGTLEWPDGNSTTQYINISLINDNETEIQESLQLTLQANETQVLGQQSSVDIIIRDDESNQPPTATTADDIEVNSRQNVVLNGSGSDPEVQPLNYQWQQISGSNVTINNANNPQASFTAPNTASTLTFSLTVTDDFGLISTDSIVITVIAPNPEPPPNNSGGGSVFGLILLMLIRCGISRKSVEKCSNQTQ